jgi:hypothetical protein
MALTRVARLRWDTIALVLGGFLLCLGPRAATAQYLADLPDPFSKLELYQQLPSSAHDAAHAPDHRYEGAIVGGLVFGIGGALVTAAVCSSSDDTDKHCTRSTILGGVVLGGLGALAGALIGGLFPKGEGNESQVEAGQ